MRELLDFRDKRIINICITLTIGQKSISTDKVMRINDCSKRTVYNDFKFIKKHWNHLVDLQSDDNLFSFGIQSVGNLQVISRDIISKSLHVRVLCQIFMEPFLPIEHHALALNVSESSVTKSLRNVRDFLSEYDIRLLRNDQGYYFEHDDEHLLRFMFAHMLLEGYNSFYLFDTEYEVYELTDFVKYVSSKYNYLIGEIPSIILAVILRLGLEREHQGFHVQHKHVLNQYEDSKAYYEIFSKFKLDEVLGAIETILTLIFNDVLFSKVKPIAKNNIDLFINLNDLSFSEEQYHSLLTTLTFAGCLYSQYHYPSFSIVNRPFIYGSMFKERHPDVYHTIESLMNNVGLSQQVLDSGLINRIIFYVYLDIPYIVKSHTLNIMVVSDYGFDHAFLLSQKINQQFPIHNYYPASTIIHNLDLIKKIIRDEPIDLVITTSTPPCELEVDYVVINDFIDGDDIKNIFNKINCI